MKKLKSILYTGIVVALAFTACNKALDVKKVVFDVNTDKASYKVGDSVIFKFSGNPDNIVFYSGEVGNKYEFRNRLRAEGKPAMQFTSYAQYGTQTNTLQLLASTSFKGKLDSTVATGGWKDITDQATFSTGADNVASGTIDLTQFIGEKPVYIAFHYTGMAGSTQKTWTIKNFQVTNKLTSGNTLSVADLSNAGFSQISLKNPAAIWSIAINQLRIAGGNASAAENDDWVVSQALNLDKVSPDSGIALKSITSTLSKYTYIFKTPGTYKVSFIASNVTADKSDQVVVEKTITITP
jgi:hypothetical protein